MLASSDATFDTLYRDHGPAVYRRCLRILRDPDAAQDATQEVFVRLLRDRERLGPQAMALRWAYRVATNYCLNHRRDRVRRGQESVVRELELRTQRPAPEVHDLQLAQVILSRFDTQTQAVAVGVLVDEMEHEEVAEALGISRRTVARKLDRFVENARKFVVRTE